MTQSITCGEATIKLLEKYGVSTVFGIPGVHTLDLCRGLNQGVTHVQARNEQGAGFMAEGWARATGEPGVAIVISGPGVTNITTAIAQCYADSIPLLVISAEPNSDTLGKGWGVLHEVTDQKKITEPITAFSATARSAADVPYLLAKAFTEFATARPRPVHISIPIDVQAQRVSSDWEAVQLPRRPSAHELQVLAAADLLKQAKRPLIMVGGGATEASAELTQLAETLGAVVIASTAGKGIVADDHPLSLSASLPRPEVLQLLKYFDVVLAVGTELSETESFDVRMEFSGQIIRIDLDAGKLNDLYPATIGIVADASDTISRLHLKLTNHRATIRNEHERLVKSLKSTITAHLSDSEEQHHSFIQRLYALAPANTIWAGDACQLVYSGAFMIPTQQPRRWFYPAGYCALGNALPNAIGAKLAKPDATVVTLVGDGGVMFTIQELVAAAELRLCLPIIIWDNGGYKQIQDDMDANNVTRIGVEGLSPDFVMLAQACHCHGVTCNSLDEFERAFTKALAQNQPTLMIVKEPL